MSPIADMVERMLSEGAPTVAIVAAVRAVETVKKETVGLFDEPDPSEPERELFKRGRVILGKSAGGQLAKLKAACGGNISLARSKLELAATKDKPSEFIAAIIRGPVVVPTKPLTQHQQERATSRKILDGLNQFIGSQSSDGDNRVLRHDTSDGPGGVYSGVGRDVVRISAGSDGQGCKPV
jgi:hypothetical protein